MNERTRSILGTTVVASATLVLVFGCVEPVRDVGAEYAGDGGTGTGDFGSPTEDASGAVATPDPGLIRYCPSYECKPPYASCTGSLYPCNVNVMSDPLNCGGCGIVCGGTISTWFECLEGKCVPQCHPGYLDCNGIADDVCEVQLGSNENCNGCGDRCSDPAKPCIFDGLSLTGKCGCDAGQKLCSGKCVNPFTDDANCGECGVACPAVGDGGTPPANTYHGCAGGECGHLKCAPYFADCDGDIADDGCETSLLTVEHCGGCNKACDPGQTCRLNRGGQPECMCPPGKTLCNEECVDVLTDASNCGGCGVRCSALVPDSRNGRSSCSYGSCRFDCRQGWADCNGNPADGCETNLASDPRNCGSCGNTCDLLSGQPCLGGQCAVEPCSDSGEAPQ